MFKNKLFELNNINFINYLIIKEDRFRIGENELIETRTQKMLATKDGETKYIDEIVSWVIAELTREPLVIIPYPSTNKDKDIGRQLPYIIAQKLQNNYKGWIDGSGYLYRKYSLPKNTRDDVAQYESLAIKNIDFLREKNILLLDDVTTSGSSFIAGLKILASANPKRLKALAIAKKAYLKDVPLSGTY